MKDFRHIGMGRQGMDAPGQPARGAPGPGVAPAPQDPGGAGSAPLRRVGHLLSASALLFVMAGALLMVFRPAGLPPQVLELLAPALVMVGFVDLAIGRALVRRARGKASHG